LHERRVDKNPCRCVMKRRCPVDGGRIQNLRPRRLGPVGTQSGLLFCRTLSLGRRPLHLGINSAGAFWTGRPH
jgi:hypothetical protein